MSSTSIELPKFITMEFLQDLVQQYLKDETTLKITKFWGEWATKPGDNYASDMYRLHVDYTHGEVDKRKSVLLKVRYLLIILLGDENSLILLFVFVKLLVNIILLFIAHAKRQNSRDNNDKE